MSGSEKTLYLVMYSLPAWRTLSNRDSALRIKEVVMMKVIEFYVPKNFRKPLKWAPQLQLGKVIEFCSLTKKSA
jgi:hypothetical protein